MWLDQVAPMLTIRYESFLYSLTGRYLTQVVAGQGVPTSEIRSIEADIRRWAQGDFLEQTKLMVADMVRSEVVGLPDQYKAAVEARAERFVAALAQVCSENIATVLRLARGIGGGNVPTIDGTAGAVGLLIQRKAGKVDYKVKDTAGRTWGAEALVSFMVRDFVYQAKLDVALGKLSAAGETLAVVVYPKSDHANNGLVFAIDTPVEGYPTLAFIRPTVFHPNSTAMVQRNV